MTASRLPFSRARSASLVRDGRVRPYGSRRGRGQLVATATVASLTLTATPAVTGPEPAPTSRAPRSPGGAVVGSPPALGSVQDRTFPDGPSQPSGPDGPSQPSGNVPTVWDRVAECESGGDWAIDTGNGFYGGLQFELRSWRWVGGEGYPHEATKAEQIRRAERLLELQGWGAWPACSRKLGLR